MTLGVFAEILELLQRAVTQQLSQKQKQPIDLTLPFRNHRLHRLVTATKLASHRFWVRPKRRSSLSHEPLARHEHVLYFGELLPQIVTYLIHFLTVLALYVAGDGGDLLRFEIL